MVNPPLLPDWTAKIRGQAPGHTTAGGTWAGPGTPPSPAPPPGACQHPRPRLSPPSGTAASCRNEGVFVSGRRSSHPHPQRLSPCHTCRSRRQRGRGATRNPSTLPSDPVFDSPTAPPAYEKQPFLPQAGGQQPPREPSDLAVGACAWGVCVPRAWGFVQLRPRSYTPHSAPGPLNPTFPHTPHSLCVCDNPVLTVPSAENPLPSHSTTPCTPVLYPPNSCLSSGSSSSRESSLISQARCCLGACVSLRHCGLAFSLCFWVSQQHAPPQAGAWGSLTPSLSTERVVLNAQATRYKVRQKALGPGPPACILAVPGPRLWAGGGRGFWRHQPPRGGGGRAWRRPAC